MNGPYKIDKTIQVYMIHRWSMERLRALIFDELNDAGLCRFEDLSGSRPNPINADREILDGYIYGQMDKADMLAVLLPNPMFEESYGGDPSAEQKIGEIFMLELMMVEYEAAFADKPVIVLDFFHDRAEEFAQNVRSNPEVKKWNPKANPDTVSAVPIDINNKQRFAYQLFILTPERKTD